MGITIGQNSCCKKPLQSYQGQLNEAGIVAVKNSLSGKRISVLDTPEAYVHKILDRRG